MAVSLKSQLLTLRTLHGLRREDFQTLPMARRPAEAEMLQKAIEACADTLAIVNRDDRVRAYVERQLATGVKR